MNANWFLSVGRVGCLAVGCIVLVMMISVVPSHAGVNIGGGSGDCFERTVTEVCFNGECWYEVVWYPIECDGSGGGTGGGGTGGGGTGGGGTGGGGGGTGGTHPDDDTDEARFESAMCNEDNVLVVNHCNPTSPSTGCCFLNSDDGHLCTTCNCAGCCERYWSCSSPYTQSLCNSCKAECAMGFETAAAAGTDDRRDCDRYDSNPYM